MSLTNFLLAELTNLQGEARKRSPEVKESCDKLLAIVTQHKNESDAAGSIHNPGQDTLPPALVNAGQATIHPFLLSFHTRNSKLIQISVTCVQRLILHCAVNRSLIPPLLSAFSDIMGQGMDIQLKVLQTLLPLLINYKEVDLDVVTTTLHLAFSIESTKNAIVVNTASATIRQIFTFIFEASRTELTNAGVLPQQESDENTKRILEVLRTYPGMKTSEISKGLEPASLCAYTVFRELCIIGNGGKPEHIQATLSKEVCLELMEACLSQSVKVFRACPPMLYILNELLCPLLIRLFSERANFALSCRLVRVIHVLFANYHEYVVMESEIFSSIFRKLLGSQETSNWYRVLILECFDAITTQSKFIFHQSEQNENAIRISSELIGTFKTILVSENGARLIAEPSGSTTPSSSSTTAPPLPSQSSGSFLENYGLKSLASAMGGSSVSSSAADLSTSNPPTVKSAFSYASASLRVPLLDLFDKQEPPTIPPNYVPRLCLDIVTHIVHCAYMSSQLESATSNTVLVSIAKQTSEYILSMLSFLLRASIDSQTFEIVLGTYKEMLNVLGLLGLHEQRNAFLKPLCNLCLPTKAGGTSDIIVSATSMRKLTLTERNLACLKTLISACHELSSVLDSNAWYTILKTIQCADQLITSGRIDAPSGKANNQKSDKQYLQWVAETKELFSNSQKMTSEQLNEFLVGFCKLSKEHIAISEARNPAAGNQQKNAGGSTAPAVSTNFGSTGQNSNGRTSNNMSAIPTEGTFAMDRLAELVTLNISTLVTEKSFAGWNLVVDELIGMTQSPHTTITFRKRAAETLAQILVASCKMLRTTLPPDFDDSIFIEPLCRLASVDQSLPVNDSWFVDLQKIILDTINKILQGSGHDMHSSWQTIFKLIRGVILNQDFVREASSTYTTNDTEQPAFSRADSTIKENGFASMPATRYTVLIRTSFPCIQLICSDFLGLLPTDMMKDCLGLVGLFASQKEDMNISLTAIQLLWKLSDFILKRMKTIDEADTTENEAKEEALNEVDALWMSLLQELSLHCSDTRPEVQNSASQTLFRTMSLNGKRLRLAAWDECMRSILFPLLEWMNKASNIQTINGLQQSDFQGLLIGEDGGDIDYSTTGESYSNKNTAKQWDEAKIITLRGVMKTFQDFLPVLSMLGDKFDQSFIAFIGYTQSFFLSSSNEVASVANSILASLVDTVTNVDAFDSGNIGEDKIANFKAKIPMLLEVLWDGWVSIGEAIVGRLDDYSLDNDSLYTRNPSGIYRIRNRVIPIIYGQFGQEILLSYLGVFEKLYSHEAFFSTFNIQKLQSLIAICSGLVRYFTILRVKATPSEIRYDYPDDTESLTALQTKVLDILTSEKILETADQSLTLKGGSKNQKPEGVLSARELVLTTLSLFAMHPFISPRFLKNMEHFVINVGIHRVIQQMKNIESSSEDNTNAEAIARYNELTPQGFVPVNFKASDLPRIAIRRADLLNRRMAEVVTLSNEKGFTYIAFAKRSIQLVETIFCSTPRNWAQLFTMGGFSDIISALGICMTSNYHFDPKTSIAVNLMRHANAKVKTTKFLTTTLDVSLADSAVLTCIDIVRSGLYQCRSHFNELPKDVLMSIYSSILTTFSDYFIARHNMLCVGSKGYEVLLRSARESLSLDSEFSQENSLEQEATKKLFAIIQREQEFDCKVSSRFVEEIVPLLSELPLDSRVLSQFVWIISDSSRMYIKRSDLHALGSTISTKISPSISTTTAAGMEASTDNLATDNTVQTESHRKDNDYARSQSPKRDFDRTYGGSSRFTFGVVDNVLPLLKDELAQHNLRLLFVLCANDFVADDAHRTRVARLVVPVLEKRCTDAINGFITGKAVNGTVPLDAVVTRELLLVLGLLERSELAIGLLSEGTQKIRTAEASLLMRLYPQLLQLLDSIVDTGKLTQSSHMPTDERAHMKGPVSLQDALLNQTTSPIRTGDTMVGNANGTTTESRGTRIPRAAVNIAAADVAVLSALRACLDRVGRELTTR